MGPHDIIWPMITIGVALSSIAGTVVSILRLRRAPPIAEEVAKTYASKAELSREVTRLEVRMDHGITTLRADYAAQEQKLDRLTATIQTQARETERALGRIEGALDNGQHRK